MAEKRSRRRENLAAQHRSGGSRRGFLIALTRSVSTAIFEQFAHQKSMDQPSDNVRWKQRWLLGVLLVVATVVAYQPAWRAGFIWDDDAYVTQNPLLTASDGLQRIWFSTDSPSQYFPLVYTTFRVEHALWGLNPTGYHCVNILLHAVNALLAWALLSRLKISRAWVARPAFPQTHQNTAQA